MSGVLAALLCILIGAAIATALAPDQGLWQLETDNEYVVCRGPEQERYNLDDCTIIPK